MTWPSTSIFIFLKQSGYLLLVILTYVHVLMRSTVVIILIQCGVWWYQCIRTGDVIVLVPILWKLRRARQQQCPAYHVIVHNTFAFIYLCIAYANEIFANTCSRTLALIFSLAVTNTQRFFAFYFFHSLVDSLLSLQTIMSAAAEPFNRRKPAGGFPSDPRYASSTLTATPSKIACLGTTEYLSTAVLDCIIQCTALPPNLSEESFLTMIGSLGCEGYIAVYN